MTSTHSPEKQEPESQRTPWGWFLHKLDAVSLSARIISVLLILLAVGMTVAAFATRQLVWSYMIAKNDDQLTRQANLVINNIETLSNTQSTPGSAPTEYFLQLRDNNFQQFKTPLIPTLRDEVPTIPALPRSGSAGDIQVGRPYTTTSLTIDNEGNVTGKSTGQWRVVVLQWQRTGAQTENDVFPPGVDSGYFFLALSLDDVIDTSDAIVRYFLVVGFLILALAMALGTVAISRTLAPLKRIEKTAAKIAAGDLSMRVPPLPENTEVGSLAASLNIMLNRIEKSFKEQELTTNKMKHFVSDASHELRTPLAAIHGYAELYRLQRESPGALERADQAIERIETSSTRMAALVEDLLSLARLDEGRGAAISDSVSIDRMLLDIFEDLHALDPNRPVKLGTMQAPPPNHKRALLQKSQSGVAVFAQFEEGALPAVTMIADSSRLRQVFTNIVGNIHRYTPADSPVEVSLTPVKVAMTPEKIGSLGTGPEALVEFLDAVEVSATSGLGVPCAFVRFSDHGPGVSEESLGQLFERFYTADASRARAKGGTGLGMAIAKSVIKAHSGFICATRSSGGGLTINIALPLNPPASAITK